MSLQLRRSFTSLLGNSAPHHSMAQSGSVVNLNHLGMNTTGGEISRSMFLVNFRRARMIPCVNKGSSSCCALYKPMASAVATTRFSISHISSVTNFALPSYGASANRFYSQLPRSLKKGDVSADGSEGSLKSSHRLRAVAYRRKTSSISKNCDSVAEVESQSAKQESKTKEVKKVTRSRKVSKDGELSGKEAAELSSTSLAKNTSSTSSAKKSSSASSAKKLSSASKRPTLAKGKTLSSADDIKENIAEDKQDESTLSSIKKGSTKKKSTKKEKVKAQEITDINSLVKSELKPLYPPNGKSVVVVESVTKAKVIQAYLGHMYEVLPSYGHVRDLAARSGSVRPDDDFSMVWEVPSAAWTHLKSINVALSGADNLILASDPDREGEAIAWHILEMLRQQDALHDNISVSRAVFHEITETSIKAALQSPRHIDANLVHAYLARRALDYLIGFNISPVLWRKLPGCQSAGRVQSAALSLISDREMEIDEFKPLEYWSCGVEFKRNPTDEFPFSSNLTFFASKKLSQLSISSETEAKNIEEKVMSSSFKVAGYKSNKTRKNPPPPYITSTLQQDAANKLHFSATYTMKLAQKLYEGIQLADGKAVGLITYTRTDGLHISDAAVKDIQSFVRERYGLDFAAKTARNYFKKVKNAQEAHEAVRPTDIRRLPSMLVNILDGDSLKLYSLIWSRTMACQMEPAVFAQIHVDIKSDDESLTFSSSCSKNNFLGYQAAFKDVEFEAGKLKDNEEADREKVSEILNSLKPGDHLTIGRVDLKQHFTQPPPRFSEASLVKKLEELGIGRPSTYASTLKVLQDRNYMTVKSRVLHPEFRGRMVSAFLSHHFSEVTDLSFTADMETELDNVSAGLTEWKGLLKDYWTRFNTYCERAATIHIHQVEKMLEKTYGNFLFASLPDQNRTCPSCSEGTLIFKVSRFGSGYFIGCDQHPTCKYIAKTLYGGEETDDVPQSKIRIEEPKLLGLHPTSNEKILLKNGPYGLYVQLGEDRKGYTPKRASLSQTKDKDAITVEDALELLRYPVTLGTHPKDGSPVIVKLAKVGFTIRHRRNIADLPKGIKPGDVTLEKALEILSGKDVRQCGRPKGKMSVEEALDISLLSNI